MESSEINYTNAPSRAKKIIETNDVIFATTRPTLNRMAIIPFEYNNHICSTGFTVLRANKEVVLSEYIFYSLQEKSFMDKMEKMQRGASYPAVSDNDVKNFQIPVPPLPEQKQIVKTLDLAFKQIDQAKANMEKNLANAKELFASKLNEVFSQRGEGWEEKKLEELSPHKNAIVSVPFGSNLKVSDYRDSGVPIIRLQNVGKGRFIEKDIKYIEEEKAEELKSHSFVTGDIVLAKLGIPIGKTCIIPESFSDGIILADIVRIRPDRRIVNYNF